MSKIRGKIIILLMFAAAASIAGFSIWYNQRQSYRVIAALSPRVTQLIAYAPQAEIMRLLPTRGGGAGGSTSDPPENSEIVNIQNHTYRISTQKNALALEHFTDVRHWLLHNDNYDWNPSPDNNVGGWQYLVEFTDGANQARLAFDLHHQCLMLLPDGAPLCVVPMQEGLQAFFDTQFLPVENAAPNTD
ncbi:MAG TPA: hypothetical protein VMJ32_16670 [Pirellulales bacterium]|nr:hypothetical protein [Pirellulales bacterium]